MRNLCEACLILTLSLACAAPASGARSALVSPLALKTSERDALRVRIEKARAADAKPFDALARLRERLPDLDAQKRGRLVPLSPSLKAMGPSALLPMLEVLAFGDSRAQGLSETAWRAWAVGLIEAVGALRDSSAAPVLWATLEGPEADFSVVRAATAALGKLGDDRTAQRLVSLSRAQGPKQRAVRAGLGECRRLVAAQALAEALQAESDPERAHELIESLGEVGNAWAWRTPAVEAKGEEEAIRALAAQALVEAFVANDGRLRSDASNELMIVDSAKTPELIAAERARADAQLASELDALAARFQANPAR